MWSHYAVFYSGRCKAVPMCFLREQSCRDDQIMNASMKEHWDEIYAALAFKFSIAPALRSPPDFFESRGDCRNIQYFFDLFFIKCPYPAGSESFFDCCKGHMINRDRCVNGIGGLTTCHDIFLFNRTGNNYHW